MLRQRRCRSPGGFFGLSRETQLIILASDLWVKFSLKCRFLIRGFQPGGNTADRQSAGGRPPTACRVGRQPQTSIVESVERDTTLFEPGHQGLQRRIEVAVAAKPSSI